MYIYICIYICKYICNNICIYIYIVGCKMKGYNRASFFRDFLRVHNRVSRVTLKVV